MPIAYDGGIFRVEKIVYDRPILRISITGSFSEKDPNGHELNGWKDDELTKALDEEVTSSVNFLEV